MVGYNSELHPPAPSRSHAILLYLPGRVRSSFRPQFSLFSTFICSFCFHIRTASLQILSRPIKHCMYSSYCDRKVPYERPWLRPCHSCFCLDCPVLNITNLTPTLLKKYTFHPTCSHELYTILGVGNDHDVILTECVGGEEKGLSHGY